MKSFVAYLMVFSLVGSALCARHRRQAPPAPDAAVQGIPEDVTTQAPVDGFNIALGFILADLNDEASKGAPLDPEKVATVNKLSLLASLLGGGVNEQNKAAIANLDKPAAADDAPAA